MNPRAQTDELPWDTRAIERVRSRLLAFFDERRRDLPWRDGAGSYGVLVSEVMSQQTRVETVVPYYRRWMERFPDPATLAAAETGEVLSLWEGLGYYSRARNLQRAAREIEARYGGEVPADPEELRSLPGVGPYTAGAVASIAFGVPVPAVDGNVRRVLARLMDEPAPRPAELERWAGALVDPGRPGDFNQALMELGSLVCTPRSPKCPRCPLREFCRAWMAGTVEERPERRRRAVVPHLHEAVLVVVRGSGGEGAGGGVTEPEVLMRRRPEEGLLGGLWEFPGVEVRMEGGPGGAWTEGGPRGDGPESSAGGGVAAAEAAPRAALELGRKLGFSFAGRTAKPPDGSRDDEGYQETGLVGLPVVDHAFSHRRVSYHPHLLVVRGKGEGVSGGREWPSAPGGGMEGEVGTWSAGDGVLCWVGLRETAALPIPVAQRAIEAAVVEALEG
jgi:A/G-specific adenine glycosylase